MPWFATWLPCRVRLESASSPLGDNKCCSGDSADAGLSLHAAHRFMLLALALVYSWYQNLRCVAVSALAISNSITVPLPVTTWPLQVARQDWCPCFYAERQT